MLNPARLLTREPRDPRIEQLLGTREHRAGAGQSPTASARKPRCVITTATLGRQEFISRHVKLNGKGVEIGGHAATSVVDVDISNADLRHPSLCLLRARRRRHHALRRGNQRLNTPDNPTITSKSGRS